MNSLNSKNVNQVPPANQSFDEEFYLVVKCQLSTIAKHLSKGVAGGQGCCVGWWWERLKVA